jgi:hypothetical protein
VDIKEDRKVHTFEQLLPRCVDLGAIPKILRLYWIYLSIGLTCCRIVVKCSSKDSLFVLDRLSCSLEVRP